MLAATLGSADSTEGHLAGVDKAGFALELDELEVNIGISIDQVGILVQGSNKTTAPVVQIKFKVADDWGTGSDDVGFKFRITFKKDD